MAFSEEATLVLNNIDSMDRENSEATPEFKPGMSFRARIPFSEPDTIKVHIDHVLPSIYPGRKLLVYRVFGKHKRWWHEKMCTDKEMSLYKESGGQK